MLTISCKASNCFTVTENKKNFTQLKMLFGTKDESITVYLEGTIWNKYTEHDIQNKLLNIVSRHVLLSKLETIRKSVFFSIIVDEYTNITNKEQFPFRIYTVDENLEGRFSWLLWVRKYKERNSCECNEGYFVEVSPTNLRWSQQHQQYYEKEVWSGHQTISRTT